MSNFGALTDHFGLATADLILVDSSSETDALSRADAEDENGDIAASVWFGNTAKDLKSVSCSYLLKSGTLNLNILACGECTVEAAIVGVIESIEAGTENKGWPKIDVSGKLGTKAVTAPTGFKNTFKLPSLTLKGMKQAQPMGFTVEEGCRLTSSTLSASIDLAQAEDGLGEPAAHGISGGVISGSAEFVAITDAPAWVVTLPDATETQAPGVAEGQAASHTGTGTFEAILVRDTVA